jgi:hypothetical protein
MSGGLVFFGVARIDLLIMYQLVPPKCLNLLGFLDAVPCRCQKMLAGMAFFGAKSVPSLG